MTHLNRTLFACLLMTIFHSNQSLADIYISNGAAMTDEIHLSNVPTEASFEVLIQEPIEAVAIKTTSNNHTSSYPFDGLVNKAAIENQLSPELLHAVIAVESKHNPVALSSRGAKGLMQLMPSTVKDYRVANPYNPEQNIAAGAKHLKAMLKLFNGNLNLALAAYNAGPETVKHFGMRIPPFAETQNYVAKIMKKISS